MILLHTQEVAGSSPAAPTIKNQALAGRSPTPRQSCCTTQVVGWSHMENILVTGATGNVGRQVVSQLLATDARVRAMARSPESAGLPRQVEVVHGDLTVPATLDRCLDGVDAVFLMWQAPAAGVAPALERIAKHGRRIVFLSNLTVRDGIEEQAYPVTTLHARIERLIEVSGVRWTFLRPGAFAANARIWWAPQVRAGDVVRWPYPGAVTSPIHEHDIAAVAVRALCEEGHAGAKYILTGPQSLTQRDQVRAIGDAISRPLRFEEIPPEAARREMANIMPASIADMLLDAWQNVEYAGSASVGKPALVTSTVTDITGVPARSFHDWAVDHAGDFQQ
jgi:uncharacterized protein YbjT (DUF2867 family)